MKKIDNFILYHNNYNLNIVDSRNNTNIHLTNDTSKYCIFNTLSKCKYFIYPLINLDNNLIHYDTFGYVVLEALLHGVIVITPKIQVYEELYGDAICYIDTSDIIEKDDLSIWKNANNDNTFSLKSIPNFGYPCIDKYIEKVNNLENDERLRNSYIEKGLALKEKFSSTNIANHLLQFLEMNN
jgi:glycosyltransferase involved in cell wall biosynthesis